MNAASFVVRSELTSLEGLGRRPYQQVHMVKTSILDQAVADVLADSAYEWASVHDVGDINTSLAQEGELLAAAQTRRGLVSSIAAVIHSTGVYGADSRSLDVCSRAVHKRLDFLASVGASFHNDTSHEWTSCLFWVLALDVADVEFVMPHLDLRIPLERGDLVVFDPSMAHGLCRPSDRGVFIRAHFESETGGGHQAFLSGELLLDDDQWASLGCPWQPANAPQLAGAVDLLNAEFDPRTGSVIHRLPLAA